MKSRSRKSTNKRLVREEARIGGGFADAFNGVKEKPVKVNSFGALGLKDLGSREKPAKVQGIAKVL